jgi:hypothetical protein
LAGVGTHTPESSIIEAATNAAPNTRIKATKTVKTTKTRVDSAVKAATEASVEAPQRWWRKMVAGGYPYFSLEVSSCSMTRSGNWTMTRPIRAIVCVIQADPAEC